MTAPRTNVTGIQAQEEKKQPDKGVTQTTITEARPASVSGISAIQGTPPPAPVQQPTVRPIGQVDREVAKPIQPVKPVVQPQAVSPVRPIGVVDKRVAEPVKAAVKPVTTPTLSETVTPPQRGIDFKEQEKILQEQVAQQVQRAEEQGAIEQKNIANTFSHLTSQGKDSGFINARNLAAARSANRGVRDAKFQINTEFNKNMFDIAKQKAAQNAGFAEESYINWISNANDQINAFADAGDYESAAEMAGAYAEVDDNNVFKKWSNPEYVDLMQKSFDANNIASFNQIRDNVNSIAINSALEGFNMKQSKDSILAEFDQNELGKKEMIDFVASVDPTEYNALNVPEQNRDVLDDFRNGDLDVSSDAVRDAFADLYIREAQDARKTEDLQERIGNLPSSLADNPMAVDMYDTIINDTGGSIEWEPTEGLGVEKFSIYGRDIDLQNSPEDLESAPGFDVFVLDVNDEPYTDEYTMEQGRSAEVDGLPENAGFYTDIYRDYHRTKTKEYEGLPKGSLERQNFEVKNFQEFLDDTRDAQARTKDEILEVVEGPIREGRIGDVRVSDLNVEPGMFKGDARDTYIDILQSDNLNDLSLGLRDMKDILEQGTLPGNFSTTSVVKDLIREGKIHEGSLPTDSTTGRDNLITDANHEFFGENMETILKSLDDNNEGFVAMDEGVYRVKATAGMDRQSGKSYHPVVFWELTPVAGGETRTARSRFSEGTVSDVSSNLTANRWHERDKGSAKKHAQDAIDSLKGSEAVAGRVATRSALKERALNVFGGE